MHKSIHRKDYLGTYTAHAISEKGLGWGPTPPSGAVATGGSGAPDTPVGRPAAPPECYARTHHMQRLVKAAVVGDAKNIRMQVNCHRQWLHHWATA